MAQVQVHGIGIDARWSQPLVLLQEVNGRGRILPIWMAEVDAAAVVAAQSGASRPRPDTHALIGHVLHAFGRHLTGVVITDMRDDVFHAELIVDGGLRIDSRTSDALVLALSSGVGIEATDAVLDRAGVPPGSVVTTDPAAPGPAAPDPTASDPTASDPTASDPAAPDVDRRASDPVTESEVDDFRRMLDDASPSDFEKD